MRRSGSCGDVDAIVSASLGQREEVEEVLRDAFFVVRFVVSPGNVPWHCIKWGHHRLPSISNLLLGEDGGTAHVLQGWPLVAGSYRPVREVGVASVYKNLSVLSLHQRHQRSTLRRIAIAGDIDHHGRDALPLQRREQRSQKEECDQCEQQETPVARGHRGSALPLNSSTCSPREARRLSSTPGAGTCWWGWDAIALEARGLHGLDLCHAGRILLDAEGELADRGIARVAPPRRLLPTPQTDVPSTAPSAHGRARTRS